MSEQNNEEFPDYVGDLDKTMAVAIEKVREGDYSRSKPTQKGWVKPATLTEADAKNGYSWTLEMEIPGTLPYELMEYLAAHPPVREDWLVPNLEPSSEQQPCVIGKVVSITIYRDAKFPNNQIKVS